MEVLGRHFLLELEDCNAKILGDVCGIERILVAAAKLARATIIESRFHQFNPFGVSGVVIIAESHLTIHTWPEHAYAAVDIFTCGKTLSPVLAADYLVKSLRSKTSSMVEINRGIKGMFIQKKVAIEGESSGHAIGKVLQMVR